MLGDDVSEADTELWQYLADRGEWYDAFRDANAIEHVVGALHLMPHAVREGYLDMWLITPDITRVMQRSDAPHKAGAVMYSLWAMADSMFTASKQEWAVWTQDEHFIVDDDGKFVRTPEGNEEGLNPYGLLPLKKISARRPPSGEFWPVGARDMLSITRAVNIALVSMEHAIINSGFTQLYAINFDSNTLGQRGPDNTIAAHNVKEGEVRPELGALNLTAQLDQQREAVEFLMQQAAILRGIPPSEFRISGAPESGIARFLDKLPLVERRKLDIAKWRRDLRGLFRIVKAVWAVERQRPEVEVPPEFNRDFSEGSELMVDFAEIEFPESQIEKIDRWKREIELGVTSPVDIIMQINPDMDRDQAKMKLLEVAQDKQEFRGAGILAAIGMEAETQ